MNFRKISFAGPFFIILMMIVLRYLFPNKMTFLIEVSIYSIYVMGNNILMGYLGYTSFGQPFYLSSGAYAAAIYLAYFGHNLVVALFLSIVFGIVLALVFGPSLMRLKGSYFTLINAALCAIGIFFVEKILINITRGNDGLWYRSNMGKLPLLDIRFPQNFFWFVMLTLLIVLYLYRKMDRSALGAIMRGVKSNPGKMKFLGYDVFKVRWLGYGLSIVMSALAGGLFAINFGFVNPNLGENTRAIEVLLATLIGGVGTVYGPFFGALGFLGMKDLVSRFFSRWELFVGILTLIVLFRFSRGIWGIVEDTGKILSGFLNRKSTRKPELSGKGD